MAAIRNRTALKLWGPKSFKAWCTSENSMPQTKQTKISIHAQKFDFLSNIYFNFSSNKYYRIPIAKPFTTRDKHMAKFSKGVKFFEVASYGISHDKISCQKYFTVMFDFTELSFAGKH